MSKRLETPSVWFVITITEVKKCVGLRERKVFPVTGTEKHWSGLNTFFIQIYVFLRVCHVTDSVSKGPNIICMKRQILGMLFGNCCLFYLLLNLS